MAEIWQGVKSTRDETALARQAERARHDLDMLTRPPIGFLRRPAPMAGPCSTC